MVDDAMATIQYHQISSVISKNNDQQNGDTNVYLTALHHSPSTCYAQGLRREPPGKRGQLISHRYFGMPGQHRHHWQHYLGPSSIPSAPSGYHLRRARHSGCRGRMWLHRG